MNNSKLATRDNVWCLSKPELRFCAGSKAGYGLPEIAMVRTSDIGPG